MNVNGEIYMTLPYILAIKDNFKILNYEVEKFICFGTPRDYEQYKFWSEYFFLNSWDSSFDNITLPTVNIFPIAGGERDFKNIGINELNFNVPLMNEPLINHTIKSYPTGLKNIFIALKENQEEIYNESLKTHNPHNTEMICLDEKKRGNAMSIIESEKLIKPDASVCVSGTSYLLEYDHRRLQNLFEDKNFDVILLSFSHHEYMLRNPKKFAYAKTDGTKVSSIVEKDTISDNPYKDQALTGTVIYKKASDLFSSIKKMINDSNSESEIFYFITAVNNLIKEGKKVIIFEVDTFISLATPMDYQEFLYWQDFFNNLSSHPYSKFIR